MKLYGDGWKWETALRKITYIFSIAVLPELCAHYVVKPSANDHRNAFLCSITQLFSVNAAMTRGWSWTCWLDGPLVVCDVCNLSEVSGLWSAGVRRGLRDIREHLSEVWVLTVANYLEEAISRPLGLDMSVKTVLRSGERACLKRICKK